MGRTNKLVDGCYSFWQGALFPLLQQVWPLFTQQTGVPRPPAADTFISVPELPPLSVQGPHGQAVTETARLKVSNPHLLRLPTDYSFQVLVASAVPPPTLTDQRHCAGFASKLGRDLDTASSGSKRSTGAGGSAFTGSRCPELCITCCRV
jgi:hypothetical protein